MEDALPEPEKCLVLFEESTITTSRRMSTQELVASPTYAEKEKLEIL